MTDQYLHKIKSSNLSKLTNEERIELFNTGDFDTLIKSYILFFKKKAMQFAYNNKANEDEYFSILLEGAAKALTKYDPDTSPYINSYICTSAINLVLQHENSQKMKKRTGINVEFEGYHSPIHTDEYVGDSIDVNYLLDDMFEILKEDDKVIMNLIREGKTQRDIATILGKTHQNISSKVSRIMNKLQNNIKKYKHG